MKVIQIMPEFGLAGAEIMCENLSSELKKMGIDIVVISMFDFHSAITDRLEEQGIRVIYLNKKPGLDLSMIPKMITIFRKEKPDVIHTHRYVMQYAIPAALFGGVKKRVHTLHNIASKENTEKGQKLSNLFFHRFHVIPVALSDEVKRTVIERYHLDAGNIPVVFNGINLDKCLIKTDYHVNGTFKFLHIGRFAPAKNHLMFLRSYRKVLEVHPDTHLTLVGTGEMEQEIRSAVIELGLENHVTFYGITDNVYPLLAETDAFILPSSYEGMPMTLLEAMASALPIVTTEVGGIPDMLINGKEALLQKPTEESITDGMLQIYDYDLRKKLGTAARKKALEYFSAETMAEKYRKIYQ